MTTYKVPFKQRLQHWFSKWTIADLLNRSVRTCWCSLVDWVLYEREGDREEDDNHKLRYHVSGGERCRQESADPDVRSCYCGKFADGQLRTKDWTPDGAA